MQNDDDLPDQLAVCTTCTHVTRSVPENAGVRNHPWGGRSFFDRIRLHLTFSKLQRIAKELGPELRVLEIGYGSGALLELLANSGHRVTGIERGLLQLPMRRGLGRNATLLCGRIEDICLPRGVFDLAYAVHVIEHVDDVQQAMRAIAAALRPGGVLVLITPDGNSAGLSLFRNAWWNLEDPTHVRFFTETSITRLLQANNFERIQVRKPIWDSVLVEPLSIIRLLVRRAGKYGVLARPGIVILALTLAPLTTLLRVFWIRLRPSLLVIASKGSTRSSAGAIRTFC